MFSGQQLQHIFESFLGDSYHGVSENGQMQVNCPFCNSGKPNLELSLSKGIYHSWCCPEHSGRLSALIKEFGNERIYQEYKTEIQNIRESRLYKISFGDKINMDFGEQLFELPSCCKKINPFNPKHVEAYEYLLKRGLNMNIINKYNICCTGYECDDWKMRYRIIIPSYDKFNRLNYYVGRLYRDNKKATKYLNPAGINKKTIVFNEYLINWDGDIRLCEGPFDSLVIPNSIPILGKKLDSTFYLYKVLMEKARSITLIPDNDAQLDWLKIGYNLNRNNLRNNVKIISYEYFKNHDTDNDTNIGTDPSNIYEKYGYKGICQLLKYNGEII